MAKYPGHRGGRRYLEQGCDALRWFGKNCTIDNTKLRQLTNVRYLYEVMQLSSRCATAFFFATIVAVAACANGTLGEDDGSAGGEPIDGEGGAGGTMVVGVTNSSQQGVGGMGMQASSSQQSSSSNASASVANVSSASQSSSQAGTGSTVNTSALASSGTTLPGDCMISAECMDPAAPCCVLGVCLPDPGLPVCQ